MTSALEMFSIGIGPSSSHTVGPMRAAARFVDVLQANSLLDAITRIKLDLFGSLGATGRGHGTDRAVIMGLLGADPETVDPDRVQEIVGDISSSRLIRIGGYVDIPFHLETDVEFHLRRLQGHPNALTLTAFGQDGTPMIERTYLSIGGGFIVDPDETLNDATQRNVSVAHPFATAGELLEHCRVEGVGISDVVRRNEMAALTSDELDARLLQIWEAMQECIARGISRPNGELPGGLRVPRRAPALYQALQNGEKSDLSTLEWVNLYALAVNEENAAGGRVVTAPTNGAAGIIPAVLSYYVNFVPQADADGVVKFLLTASAVGILIKTNASISGADVGCQGEVGSACAMAAAGLAEVLGGTPMQVENAAEIALEHNLGLTCDPVAGLVQIPCIERNAIAAAKAINAARLALHGDGRHRVSLDQAIGTLRSTGADMNSKYKETSRGGLAVNVVEC